MTNFTLFYDRDIKLKKSKVNGFGTIAFNGVYYDGYYYWICQDQSILQVIIDNSFTFHVVQNIDVSNLFGNAGTGTPTAIGGDGKDLYIGLEYAVGSPAAVQRHQIMKINKDGVLLTNFSSTVRQAPQTEILDITTDGLKIYYSYADGGAPSKTFIAALDVSTNTIIATDLGTNQGTAGLEYDGLNFIRSKGTLTQILNRDYTAMKDLGTQARASKGITMVNDGFVSVA